AATAAIARAVRPAAPDGSLWREVAPVHPLGGPVHHGDSTHCDTCAWAQEAGPGPPVLRCNMRRVGLSPAPRVDGDWPGCDRWEPRIDDGDCADCGACCREAFDLVPVSPSAPLVAERADLVVRDPGGGCHVPRPGG